MSARAVIAKVIGMICLVGCLLAFAIVFEDDSRVDMTGRVSKVYDMPIESAESAVGEADLSFARLLCARDQEVCSEAALSGRMWSWLHEAAYFGLDAIICNRSTEAMECVNILDPDGRSPLHCVAAGAGRISTGLRLIGHGADIDMRDSMGRTALSLASEFCRCELAGMLLNAGATVDACDDEGRTPAWYAVWAGCREVLIALALNGANLAQRSSEDWTLLHFAAFRDRVSIVDFLIESGVDEMSRNSSGALPLMYAASSGQESVFRRLLLRADGDEVDSSGNTTLHYAAGGGCPEVIKLCLGRVSDHNKKNMRELRAIDVACDAAASWFWEANDKYKQERWARCIRILREGGCVASRDRIELYAYDGLTRNSSDAHR